MRSIFLTILIATLVFSCIRKDNSEKVKFFTLEQIISKFEKGNIRYESISKIFNYSQLNCPIYIDDIGNLPNTCIKKYNLGDTCNLYIPTEICKESTVSCHLSDTIQRFTQQGIWVFCEKTTIIPINESYERIEVDSIRYLIYKAEKYFFLESYNPYANGSTNYLKIYILYKKKFFILILCLF